MPEYRRLPVVLLAALLVCALPRAASAQTAYIGATLPDDVCPPPASSCNRGVVMVVDSTNGTVLHTIDLWRSANLQFTVHSISDLQVSPDGTQLYVLWAFGAFGPIPGNPFFYRTLAAYDTTSLAKVDEVTLGGTGGRMTVSPDGSRLFVAGTDLASAVFVFDTATLEQITHIPSDFPNDVAVSRDGQRLFAGLRSPGIDVHDTTTLAKLTTIPLPAAAQSLVVSSDGTHLYAIGGGVIADIDPQTNTVSATITEFGAAGLVPVHAVSANHRLWVAAQSSTNTTSVDRIIVFDEATRAIVDHQLMPRPGWIAATGDQKRVMAAASTGSVWRTIDAISGAVILDGPGMGTFGKIAFGPAPPVSELTIDIPGADTTVTQPFDIGGWAIKSGGYWDGPGISRLTISIVGAAGPPLELDAFPEYFRPREDVAAIFGPGYLNSGYRRQISGLPPGAYTFVVRAYEAGASTPLLERSVSVIVNIDAPASTLTRNPLALNFAAKRSSSTGMLTVTTPPQQVTVGFSGAMPAWTATANKPWVKLTGASGTGAGQFTIAIDPASGPIGGESSQTALVVITAPNANPVVIPVQLKLFDAATDTQPAFGMIDAPAQASTGLTGAINLSGWAVDDVGVSAIKVYRECLPFDPPWACSVVEGTSLVYLGDAVFLAGARPDVEAVFPTYPRSYAAGWGMQILSNMLPDVPNGLAYGGQGTIAFHVYAVDEESHLTRLGRAPGDHTPTYVSLDNHAIARPFGTLDTPAPGQTVSGFIANFGWALTPDLNTSADGTDILIPIDGSTIVVFVDSMPMASATYNQCRGNVGTPPPPGVFCNDDIANFFGNTAVLSPMSPRFSNPTKFRNLDAGRGAIGAFLIDTTLLANGLHTIAWSVTDSSGRVEGIGSRFFTTLNGESAAASGLSLQELLAQPAVDRGSATLVSRLRASKRRVSIRTGFDLRTPMRPLPQPSDKVASVEIPATGRVEVSLAGPGTAAYLVVNGALRDLPVGSTFDAKSGVFAWTPPPGMFGTYRVALVAGAERVLFDVVVGRK